MLWLGFVCSGVGWGMIDWWDGYFYTNTDCCAGLCKKFWCTVDCEGDNYDDDGDDGDYDDESNDDTSTIYDYYNYYY